MGTVTITGVSPDPEIYGANLAAAQNYIGARFGDKYVAWLALSSIAPLFEQQKSLVSATDFLDRLGLVDGGVAITHATTLPKVIAASYEMAVLINDDPDIVELLDQAFNIKEAYAGGAGVEFQNPTSVLTGTATQLPVVVQQLLAAYLPAASSTVIGGYSSAGETRSAFSDCSDYDRNEPY